MHSQEVLLSIYGYLYMLAQRDVGLRALLQYLLLIPYS